MTYRVTGQDADLELVKVKAFEARAEIEKMPGVIGTSISYSSVTKIGEGFNVVVYLEKHDEKLIKSLPGNINGLPVVYKVTGKIYAKVNTTKTRPLLSGSSIGILGKSGTGSLGGFPKDANGKYVILSNNHVIGNQWANNKTGKIGDTVIQPSTKDGGKSSDVVGKLSKYVYVYHTNTGIENKVDCAYAMPTVMVNSNSICNYNIDGSVYPQIGQPVKKAGRTSGCTKGIISSIDVRIKVEGDSPSNTAIFSDQIEISGKDYIEPGDSGSLSVDENTNQVIGLNFAGSDNINFANKIKNVESALGISFGKSVDKPVTSKSPAPSNNNDNVAILYVILGFILLLMIIRMLKR